MAPSDDVYSGMRRVVFVLVSLASVAAITFGSIAIVSRRHGHLFADAASVPTNAPITGDPSATDVATNNSIAIAAPGRPTYLDQLMPTASMPAGMGPATINGHTYGHSLMSLEGDSSSGSVSYNLNGMYSKLTMVVGMGDDSYPGTTIRYQVFVDNIAKVNGVATIGAKPAVLNIDVQGGSVLRLSENEIHNNTDHVIVFGLAELFR